MFVRAGKRWEVAARGIFADSIGRAAERWTSLVVKYGAPGAGGGGGGRLGAAHRRKSIAASRDLGAANDLKLLNEVAYEQVDLLWRESRSNRFNRVDELGFESTEERFGICKRGDQPLGRRPSGAPVAHCGLRGSVELLAFEPAVGFAQQREEAVAERVALRMSRGVYGHGFDVSVTTHLAQFDAERKK